MYPPNKKLKPWQEILEEPLNDEESPDEDEEMYLDDDLDGKLEQLECIEERLDAIEAAVQELAEQYRELRIASHAALNSP